MTASVVRPSPGRPSWDEYFQEIAQVVAKRSTCLRRQVGAILVRDRRILTTGYNGAPQGLPHCAELGGCYREQIGVPSGQRHELCRGLHAEQNAIIQAAVHGIQVTGSMLYVTISPCALCAKMLINAGVIRVVYRGDYPDELAMQLFNEAGMEVVRWYGPREADGQ
ncbi:MAG: deoxycytidylate deaminase [Candidatus Zipacnadales bacterium]